MEKLIDAIKSKKWLAVVTIIIGAVAYYYGIEL